MSMKRSRKSNMQWERYMALSCELCRRLGRSSFGKGMKMRLLKMRLPSESEISKWDLIGVPF